MDLRMLMVPKMGVGPPVLLEAYDVPIPHLIKCKNPFNPDLHQLIFKIVTWYAFNFNYYAKIIFVWLFFFLFNNFFFLLILTRYGIMLEWWNATMTMIAAEREASMLSFTTLLFITLCTFLTYWGTRWLHYRHRLYFLLVNLKTTPLGSILFNHYLLLCFFKFSILFSLYLKTRMRTVLIILVSIYIRKYA